MFLIASNRIFIEAANLKRDRRQTRRDWMPRRSLAARVLRLGEKSASRADNATQILIDHII